MARTKGAKNKNTSEIPVYSTLPTPDRIFLLANLIVDRIDEDQSNGGELIHKLLEQENVRPDSA